MNELKPCPFCGSKAAFRYVSAFPRRKCWISCLGCSCMTAVFASEEEATTFWNKRTPDWIPVTEKMPEELEPFIGLDKRGRVFEAVNAFDEIEIEGITHWMPMPEPPEGRKEGE